MAEWPNFLDQLLESIINGNSRDDLMELLLCFVSQYGDIIDVAVGEAFSNPFGSMFRELYTDFSGYRPIVFDLDDEFLRF